MKIVAIIPSRYGSTRFAGKPLAQIAVQVNDTNFSNPMIRWTYDQACKAKSVDEVYVATDDERIVSTVQSFGGNALMTSEENRSGTDRVGEAAEIIGLDAEDLIINIQGDQPAFCSESLDALVAPFKNDPALKMSTLAYETDNRTEFMSKKDCKVTLDRNGYALYFSRAPIPCSRDRETVGRFYKHLGFYAYTFSFLNVFRRLPTGRLEDVEKLEQLRVLENGYRIKVEISAYDSPEVDLPDDIPRIEAYMRENRHNLGFTR